MLQPTYAGQLTLSAVSRWPRGLRRRSAAVRLLGLRVRIPLGAWLSVPSERCVVEWRSLGQADLSTREVLRSMMCLCDHDTSTTRRSRSR